jgi:hypothetical protein
VAGATLVLTACAIVSTTGAAFVVEVAGGGLLPAFLPLPAFSFLSRAFAASTEVHRPVALLSVTQTGSRVGSTPSKVSPDFFTGYFISNDNQNKESGNGYTLSLKGKPFCLPTLPILPRELSVQGGVTGQASRLPNLRDIFWRPPLPLQNVIEKSFLALVFVLGRHFEDGDVQEKKKIEIKIQ